MASYQPALPDVPRYTHWDQVPVGLFTKTQLGQMDPPRKPAKDAAPVGQVLYHGNSYAPLYALTDTVLKRTASPAQKAALERARRLQFVCRFCDGKQLDGFGEAVSLGKGRTCDRCSAVRRIHGEHRKAAERAEELHARLLDRTAVLLAADDPARPSQLRLASVGQVLTVDLAVPGEAAPSPGALEPGEAFTLIGDWLTEHLAAGCEPLILCWDTHPLRYGLCRLLAADLPDPGMRSRLDPKVARAAAAHAAAVRERSAHFPWLADEPRSWWRSFRETYTRFHAEPSRPGDDPTCFQPNWNIDVFDGTTTAQTKAAALWKALEDTAQGQGVSPRAPWLVHPEALDQG